MNNLLQLLRDFGGALLRIGRRRVDNMETKSDRFEVALEGSEKKVKENRIKALRNKGRIEYYTTQLTTAKAALAEADLAVENAGLNPGSVSEDDLEALTIAVTQRESEVQVIERSIQSLGGDLIEVNKAIKQAERENRQKRSLLPSLRMQEDATALKNESAQLVEESRQLTGRTGPLNRIEQQIGMEYHEATAILDGTTNQQSPDDVVARLTQGNRTKDVLARSAERRRLASASKPAVEFTGPKELGAGSPSLQLPSTRDRERQPEDRH